VTRVDRIVVIGSGGAGKTVLAHRLGALLGIGAVHLDTLFYDDAWRPVPVEVFVAAQQRIVAGRRWLLDGNYHATLPVRLAVADTVVFLDLPPLVCLWGVFVRRWRYRGGQHRDGVYDRVSVAFLRYVATYRRRMRPRVLAAIAEHGPHARLVRLGSRAEVHAFLATVTAMVNGPDTTQ